MNFETVTVEVRVPRTLTYFRAHGFRCQKHPSCHMIWVGRNEHFQALGLPGDGWHQDDVLWNHALQVAVGRKLFAAPVLVGWTTMDLTNTYSFAGNWAESMNLESKQVTGSNKLPILNGRSIMVDQVVVVNDPYEEIIVYFWSWIPHILGSESVVTSDSSSVLPVASMLFHYSAWVTLVSPGVNSTVSINLCH